jgi:hypothetical protein
MFSGGAEPDMFLRIRVKVDICRFKSCIYRVIRDHQLGIIDLNRRYSLDMETRLFVHHRS